MVALWEQIPPEDVNALFSDYLFKIKRWAANRDAPDRGFTSADVGLFKGIRESDPSNADNGWALPFLYAKNFTDDFQQENASLIRYGAMRPLDYPHQIDQPIINGESFFRMVAHYYGVARRYGLYGMYQTVGDGAPAVRSSRSLRSIGRTGASHSFEPVRLPAALLRRSVRYSADRSSCGPDRAICVDSTDCDGPSHQAQHQQLRPRADGERREAGAQSLRRVARSTTCVRLRAAIHPHPRSREERQGERPEPELLSDFFGGENW